MNSVTIAIIIGVSVVVAIAAVMLFMTISNKRKSKKLQEHLKKIKQQDKTKELEEQNISIANTTQGENVSEEEIFGTSSGQQGFFASSKIRDTQEDEVNGRPFRPNRREEEELPKMPNRPSYREEQEKRKSRDEDFENFLDEHAFSRKVFDKNLLNKIKKLPPEIKSVIMGNIFDKFNDDK